MTDPLWIDGKKPPPQCGVSQLSSTTTRSTWPRTDGDVYGNSVYEGSHFLGGLAGPVDPKFRRAGDRERGADRGREHLLGHSLARVGFDGGGSGKRADSVLDRGVADHDQHALAATRVEESRCHLEHVRGSGAISLQGAQVISGPVITTSLPRPAACAAHTPST
jgi:hypothetical protein